MPVAARRSGIRGAGVLGQAAEVDDLAHAFRAAADDDALTRPAFDDFSAAYIDRHVAVAPVRPFTGADDIAGRRLARIRSAGDAALFGKSTASMKAHLNIKKSRPLADFLPTLTIAAKNLATEMTNYNTEEKDLQGERSITAEHVHNNRAVRNMLGQRGIKPENLPPEEDIKKIERRVASEEKKLAQDSGFSQK